jgi:uncharacterized protein YabE (DUF348 family)
MKHGLSLAVAVAMLLVPASIFAHGGHAHVLGTVASISASTIVVTTSAGTKRVGLAEATKYYRSTDESHPATAADVKPGMRVVVHLGGDGKAAEVHIPAAPSQ